MTEENHTAAKTQADKERDNGAGPELRDDELLIELREGGQQDHERDEILTEDSSLRDKDSAA